MNNDLTLESIMKQFAILQSSLKDLETHLGWLLARALRAFQDEGAHIIQNHYTADGVTAKIYLPFDKKYYCITIQEEK